MSNVFRRRMAMQSALDQQQPMLPLHPNVRWVWMFSSLISTLIFGGIIATAEILLSKNIPEWQIPMLLITAVYVMIFFPLAFIMPRLQFERWRYAIRPQDVLIEYGVIWRNRRCIPRLRIQHVDINSGPIDRMLGLVHMNVYTAGSMGPVVSIPGMTPEKAESIREELIGTKASNG